MKTFYSLLIFLLVALAPCIILYIALEGILFELSLFIFLGIWTYAYFYLDKFLLMVMNAREVMDSDEQNLFQKVKNTAYKSIEKTPSIYLYSGYKPNCFVFESRGDWVIVIEREFLSQLTGEQVESLVQFLFLLKKEGNSWLYTKILGIIIILHQITFIFLNKILMLSRSGFAFKILSVFTSLMLRPFVYPLEKLIRSKKDFLGGESLKPLKDLIEPSEVPLNTLMLGQLNGDVQLRKILVGYLESFPVLGRLKFDEKQI